MHNTGHKYSDAPVRQSFCKGLDLTCKGVIIKLLGRGFVSLAALDAFDEEPQRDRHLEHEHW